MKTKTISISRLNEFIQNSFFEISEQGNGYIVGLKHGYSVYLIKLGFSRAEQIRFLNYLEQNIHLINDIL
jgi:hypothetical protein